ncbi:hypothetical protein PVK06_001345 [Gossypium arboreum]|uniref:Uncharacterized protein n=1 Tax=Gossypium arboreum TaxID=29729 RepID=A0ABR0R0Z5_GOSAR|nr:hypothetical protein PVK06_001345 [Gossypium arboreum]
MEGSIKGWYVVLRNISRDLFDMGGESRDDDDPRKECLPFVDQNLDENIPGSSIEYQWIRDDVDEDIYE